MSERTYCICNNCGDIELATDGDTHGQTVAEYYQDGTPYPTQVQCGELKDIKTYVAALESRVSELEQREKAVDEFLLCTIIGLLALAEKTYPRNELAKNIKVGK